MCIVKKLSRLQKTTKRLVSRKFFFFILVMTRMVAALILTSIKVDPICALLAKHVKALSDFFVVRLLGVLILN